MQFPVHFNQLPFLLMPTLLDAGIRPTAYTRSAAKNDNVASEKRKESKNRPEIPLEIGMNGFPVAKCAGKAGSRPRNPTSLGYPNRTVSRKWTRIQLGVPRQVARVTCPGYGSVNRDLSLSSGAQPDAKEPTRGGEGSSEYD